MINNKGLIDLRIDDEGDLILTDPISDGYDIVYDENNKLLKDLKLVDEEAGLRQAINFRLKTFVTDLYMHPKLGNDICELIGQRNTREIGERGRQYITEALTYDDLISLNELTVIPIPINETNILYHIEISSSDIEYKFELLCDLINGIKVV